MNECRKSIPTQDLVQENHSLMFWQFGKYHTSTCALKLSCQQKAVISYSMLIWQVIRPILKSNLLLFKEFLMLPHFKKSVKWKGYSAGNSIPTLVLVWFPQKKIIFGFDVFYIHKAKLGWLWPEQCKYLLHSLIDGLLDDFCKSGKQFPALTR